MRENRPGKDLKRTQRKRNTQGLEPEPQSRCVFWPPSSTHWTSLEGSFAPGPSVTPSRSGKERSGITSSSPLPAGSQQTRSSDEYTAPTQLLACGVVPGKKVLWALPPSPPPPQPLNYHHSLHLHYHHHHITSTATSTKLPSQPPPPPPTTRSPPHHLHHHNH